MLRLIRKGQSTAEYAIVIGLVIGAAVAMQVYVKRGIQGKMKDAVDYTDTDAVGVLGTTKQYEPYYSRSTMSGTRISSGGEKLSTGGAVDRTMSDSTTRIGLATIGDTSGAD